MPRPSAKSAEIEFVGELTVRTIAEAHRRLVEAFAGKSGLVVDIAGDAAADLAFVQLLQSARRSAREAGATLRLARPAEGALREVLERGGFLSAPADREFWLMQMEAR